MLKIQVGHFLQIFSVDKILICDQQRYAQRKLIADGWDDTVHPKRRVLNDLERARLSWARMIRLLVHPLPPTLTFSWALCAAVRAFWRKTGRGGGWARSQIITATAWPSINHAILYPRESKRDVVYLGWSLAPSYMSPNAVGWGGGLQGLCNGWEHYVPYRCL